MNQNANEKIVGLTFKIPAELRDRMHVACREQDRNCAQVLRQMVAAFVEQHEKQKEGR